MVTTLNTLVDDRIEILSRDSITFSIRTKSSGGEDMGPLYGCILGLDDESFDGIMPPRSTYELND